MTPVWTAAFFVSFIVIMNAAAVAPVLEKRYSMFSSILGTWLPFLPIFVATYFTGIWVARRRRRMRTQP